VTQTPLGCGKAVFYRGVPSLTTDGRWWFGGGDAVSGYAGAETVADDRSSVHVDKVVPILGVENDMVHLST